MLTKLFTEILALLLGRKYYANIVATKGTDKQELCSYIFRSKAEANKHKEEIATTLTFHWRETITFRSKKEY